MVSTRVWQFLRIRFPGFHTSWSVRLILTGFAILGIWYSLVVPTFETPDELYHYAFARHLALGNSLPVQNVDELGPWEHEGTQAPLYYLLVSRLLAPLDHRDFEALIVINPRANLGDPHYPGNKNFMLYSGESQPLAGTRLGVLVARWTSLSMMVGALWFTYQTARLTFGTSSAALVALGVAATIPQLAFIGAGVSNDAMIILTASATIYWLCALISRADTIPIRRWDWVVTGLLLALASLSKLQGLGLFIPAAFVIFLLARRRRNWHIIWHAGLIIALLWLTVAGWWYLRNFILYGDLLATRTLLEIEGLRSEAQSLGEFWGELRGLRYSFWGLFGWFSILLPTWVYVLLDGITLIGLGGLLDLARRRLKNARTKQYTLHTWFEQPANRVYLVLALWLSVLCAAMFYWLTFAISSQGRLLFPGVSAVAILLTLGLGHASRRSYLFWRRVWTSQPDVPLLRPHPIVNLTLLPLGLLACSFYAVIVLLPNNYMRPKPITTLPPDAIPVHRVYGDIIELVAIEKPRAVIEPESYIEVTLYLRKLQKTGQDYELFVQLLDHEIKEFANVTTHPGWGKNPTSLWEIGKIYPDTYRLYVHPPTTPPAATPPAAPTPHADLNVDRQTTLNARLFIGFRTMEHELLEVPGYEWDIDSMTVGRIRVLLE
ncbi:MAG: glycosyltransferase family 39 protein [Litorilinea sp.]